MPNEAMGAERAERARSILEWLSAPEADRAPREHFDDNAEQLAHLTLLEEVAA